MSRAVFIIIFVAISTNFANPLYPQTNNVVLEYCTGTWCQWCPCAHDIIDQIIADYPNTVVLGYHGAGSDPWQNYSLGIRGLFGFSAYPTGVVGRRTGIISRSAWNNEVVNQSTTVQPTISLEVTNKNYNPGTRMFSATVRATALTNLSGQFNINYVLTESNLIYSQTGNSSCTGSSSYNHKYVVKSMINGDAGDLISSGTWSTGTTITRNINYVVPNSPQVENVNNCDLNVFVYLVNTSISNNSNVQQALRTPLIGTTFQGININLKCLLEGLYYPLFNLQSRRDSITAFLRQSYFPYQKVDSAKGVLDSTTFTKLLTFNNASTGTYYLSINHFQSIETWSKAGGEMLVANGSVYNYDFTSSASQAYGNNLKLKGNKYCLISGDIFQDGFIDGSDLIIIDNDAFSFASGRFLPSDLNGDGFTDAVDMQIADNNRSREVIRP